LKYLCAQRALISDLAPDSPTLAASQRLFLIDEDLARRYLNRCGFFWSRELRIGTTQKSKDPDFGGGKLRWYDVRRSSKHFRRATLLSPMQ
jgi:hypothetical protein